MQFIVSHRISYLIQKFLFNFILQLMLIQANNESHNRSDKISKHGELSKDFANIGNSIYLFNKWKRCNFISENQSIYSSLVLWLKSIFVCKFPIAAIIMQRQPWPCNFHIRSRDDSWIGHKDTPPSWCILEGLSLQFSYFLP